MHSIFRIFRKPALGTYFLLSFKLLIVVQLMVSFLAHVYKAVNIMEGDAVDYDVYMLFL